MKNPIAGWSSPPPDPALVEALESSQRLGLIGSQSIEELLAHGSAFVDALADVRGTVVDLGSGGGVPGLIIARARPDLEVVLVDRKTSRADHLRRLVGRLQLTDRVRVVEADAARLRPEVSSINAVVARSFGPPQRTLALAARLVAEGGLVVLSEPPEPRSWAPNELAALGLARLTRDDARVAVFRRQRFT